MPPQLQQDPDDVIRIRALLGVRVLLEALCPYLHDRDRLSALGRGVAVEYPSTSEIMADLRELEMQIGEGMEKLEALLGL